MKQPIVAAALAALTAAAQAQEPPAPPEPFPEPPSIPSATYRGETVEPEVTIVETDREIIYEYRVRGRLYMVRVQPQVGPPYYILDTDGDGMLDTRRDRVWSNSVPQWLLFSW